MHLRMKVTRQRILETRFGQHQNINLKEKLEVISIHTQVMRYPGQPSPPQRPPTKVTDDSTCCTARSWADLTVRDISPPVALPPLLISGVKECASNMAFNTHHSSYRISPMGPSPP